MTQGPSRSALIIYSVLAVVALLGLADATYLTIAHLTGDDAVCVLGSSYASVKGIPTASFGAVAYFTVFSLSVLAAFGYPWVKRPLTLIIGLMLLTSLYLLYLQAFVLHAFCPFCLFSAALTFFLAGLLLAVPATR